MVGVRVCLRKNHSKTGCVAQLPVTWADLMALANTRLQDDGHQDQGQFCRIFLSTGDEVLEDSLGLIKADDILYCSRGEDFRAPSAVRAAGELKRCSSSNSSETGQHLADLDAPLLTMASIARHEAIHTNSRRGMAIQLCTLAHHVQRERGASCAWIAGGGRIASFAELLQTIRPAVDEALEAASACMGSTLALAIGDHIASTRRAVCDLFPINGPMDGMTLPQSDASGQAADAIVGGLALAFYAIFRGYTTGCDLILER